MPLSRGGTHTEANLRVVCSPCNLRKSNKLLSELNWASP
ncbi:MAG: HNH endonuclease [Hyphomonadaceae bacterium]